MLFKPYIYTFIYFYHRYRTRQQVQESSLRDEIQHGTVITSQKPTPTTGKKGSFKKG